MKEIVNRMQTYLAFDDPLEIGRIQATFALTHNQQQKIIPGWGTDSTRQKLISFYWHKDVLRHFAAMLALGTTITLFFRPDVDGSSILVILVVAVFTFLVMLFFHYLPNYTANFLPKLDAISTLYESEQQWAIIKQLKEELVAQQEVFQVDLQQKLADQEARLSKQHEKTQKRFQNQISRQKTFMEQQQEEIKKCRQVQLSNLALTLVYYALAKGAGINSAAGNDRVAQLLQKLYGVDRGSLRNNLDLVAGSGSKRKNLGERKLTEIQNRFEEAINFLEEIDYPQGIKALKELEIRLFQN